VQVVRALKRRGIQSLFPIQTMVLRPAMEGRDLTARAKTGSGKTLAFALPVVESLLAEDQDRKARKAPGRTPRCGTVAWGLTGLLSAGIETEQSSGAA
jgi:ATP-dependent RNA helicase DDX21